MILDPFALAMGRAGKDAGLGGVGKVLGTAEDPLQLHRTGFHYSPWTNMQLADEDEQKKEREKNMAFLNSWNSAFGNSY